MRRRQAVRDLHSVIDHSPRRDTAAPDLLAQRFSFRQLRNQVRRSRKRSQLVHGKNVGMIQGRRCCPHTSSLQR